MAPMKRRPPRPRSLALPGPPPRKLPMVKPSPSPRRKASLPKPLQWKLLLLRNSDFSVVCAATTVSTCCPVPKSRQVACAARPTLLDCTGCIHKFALDTEVCRPPLKSKTQDESWPLTSDGISSLASFCVGGKNLYRTQGLVESSENFSKS